MFEGTKPHHYVTFPYLTAYQGLVSEKKNVEVSKAFTFFRNFNIFFLSKTNLLSKKKVILYKMWGFLRPIQWYFFAWFSAKSPKYGFQKTANISQTKRAETNLLQWMQRGQPRKKLVFTFSLEPIKRSVFHFLKPCNIFGIRAGPFFGDWMGYGNLRKISLGDVTMEFFFF